MARSKEDIRQAVRDNYAAVARQNTDAKKDSGGCGCGDSDSADACCSPSDEANGCCAPSGEDDGGCGCGASAADMAKALGYSNDDLSSIPDGANMGLGCGNPVALASLRPGDTVLDLGAGGGLDCFIASRQVGESGAVIGVDMTPDMVSLARKNAADGGYTNVDFRLGEIEHLPVADNTVDVILSNCVVNLSPDKRQVYAEAYRVLKPGGRLCISDVAAIKPLTAQISSDLTMISGCIGGAELIDDIRDMLADAGFGDIRLTRKEGSSEIINSWAPGSGFGDYVASFTMEAVK